MKLSAIHSNHAPEPIGAYSQAIQCGDQLFISGQIGMDPETGSLVSMLVTEQTKTALSHIDVIVKAAGSNKRQIVKCEIYLTDIESFKHVNDVYEQFFDQKPYPARVTVGVAELPKGALVEISAIAAVPSGT